MAYKYNVVYDPNGFGDGNDGAVSDGYAEKYVNEFIKNEHPYNNMMKTSSELVILWFRVAIKEGRIGPGDLVVMYDGKAITFDKNGRCETWPDGFCDWSDKALERLFLTGGGK